jgi:hypothetical protein
VGHFLERLEIYSTNTRHNEFYKLHKGTAFAAVIAIALENAETGPARPWNAGFHEPSGDVAAKRIGLLPRPEIYTETRGYRANKDSLRSQIALP